MTGAESLVRTMIAGGVDTCFANPGTSEMHFVAALDQIPGMRCVLGLQENVVTGMADGFYRIADRPACTLLHCGPGLANGLANLHNARRAGSGMVNIVGDQATYHAPLDAPLTADIEALARTVSAWVRTSARPQDVGQDAAAAMQAARTIARNLATLILPSDSSWGRGGVVAEPLPKLRAPAIDPHAVEAAAAALRSGGPNVLILLGGRGFRAVSQRLAWRLAHASGAAILGEFVAPRVERGAGRLPLERIPYDTDAATKVLARYTDIVLVGARPPVSFFAYPDKPSRQHANDARLHILARPEQDVETALAAVVDALGVPDAAYPAGADRPQRVTGKPSPEGLARMLASVMPEGAIVSDESISFGRGLYAETHGAAPHDWLHLTGGAIGDGLPVATGAAIGAGGSRRVISLQADGSAMYSLQSLWTQARERLPVTTVLLSNRKYNILIGEYKGVGAVPGQTAMNMLDLSNPGIGWVKLAEGMGVEAVQAHSLEQCADMLEASFHLARPFLVELVI
ncbi:acetolactate synthase large subunit [Mesorhizobium sp. B2-4-15]|uniref:acetolactate synthase large subunit n=1 Tax=Mesorhizobium sp. B2-4-15 TaxID=2589934 RepID=UPI00115150F7|nr:acetolactate synthase large subunit [Mesorhizobium sp. B2-4-15]TPK60901.1 acetolactate synthase large subunit [Mesorhizobium sp. B2-4-15]